MFTMFDLTAELAALEWELGTESRVFAQRHLYRDAKGMHTYVIGEVSCRTSDQFLTIRIHNRTGADATGFAGALRSFIYRHNVAGPRVSAVVGRTVQGTRTATYTVRNPHYIPNN